MAYGPIRGILWKLNTLRVTAEKSRSSANVRGFGKGHMVEKDKQLSFLEHLDEFRTRIIIVAAFFTIFTGFSFYFVDDILHLLKIPAGTQLGPLSVFSPTAAILVFIKIAFFTGFILTSPVFLYEIWMFIRPALERKHEHHGLLFVLFGIVLFVAGILFSFYFLIPAALKFLLGIGRGDLQFIISLDSYISFVLFFMVAGGLVFEMPVMVFILVKLGILTAQKMIRSWKMAIVVIVTGAAIVTPTPDAVNMALMSLPMFVLYIFSIGVAGLAQRRQR